MTLELYNTHQDRKIHSTLTFSPFPKTHPEWSDNWGDPFGKCHEVGRSEAKAKAPQSKNLVNGF